MNINQPLNDVYRTAPELSGFDRLTWAVTGLCQEAGEVAGVFSKLTWPDGHIGMSVTPESWKDELGDTLWYLAQVAECLGLTLEDIWNFNQAKLEKRFGPNHREV